MMGQYGDSPEIIWRCKIGGPGYLTGGGNDLPMRQAIARAYREITGFEPEFIFSGWGAELTEPERAVVEDREPAPMGDYPGGGYRRGRS